MITSKAQTRRGVELAKAGTIEKKELPSLDSFIERRDFVGGQTLMKFMQDSSSGMSEIEQKLWLAYFYFHDNKYEKAIDIYNSLEGEYDPDKLNLYRGICYYYTGDYETSREFGQKCPETPLQNRLLFHLAHKFNDDESLLEHHRKLRDRLEDQLSLAAIHYQRTHYKQSIETYESMLDQYPDYTTFNAYIAMCYYRMDFAEKCIELIQQVSLRNGESLTTVNLKACAIYKLSGSEAAMEVYNKLYEELPRLKQHPLLKHNMCVFDGGEKALHTLPALVDIIPKARYNLTVLLLLNGDVERAWDYMRDYEPCDPQELILRGVAAAMYGQKMDDEEGIALAAEIFNLIGTSKSERDTVQGRQSMASNLILNNRYDEAIRYLETIESYCSDDNDFHWNYGISLGNTGKYKAALEQFLQMDEEVRKKRSVLTWIARCYIKLGNPEKAWDLYTKARKASAQSDLLQLIGNECYSLKYYEYSAKAFETLYKQSGDPEHLRGYNAASALMELNKRSNKI